MLPTRRRLPRSASSTADARASPKRRVRELPRSASIANRFYDKGTAPRALDLREIDPSNKVKAKWLHEA